MDARAAFLRGLLLLHVFEYPQAALAFQTAQKLDPTFAMAFWGEAMTYNHGVWNQVNPSAGSAALARFAPSASERAARIADEREKAYMAAVEILYDSAGSKREHDLRYAQAMQHLAQSFPQDANAQLFYALALLSQNEGVRDVPVYLQAATLSKEVFRLEPNNPGAAHYWIHGMDDPEHAAGALEAARKLSKIAPDAGHAQHMCSHIFIALGMWSDVVQSNVEAMRVVNLETQAKNLPAYHCGHYQFWLEYGYFQQGNAQAAQEAYRACQQTDTDSVAWMRGHPGQALLGVKDPDVLHRRLQGVIAEMRNTAVIESRDWTGAKPSDINVSQLDLSGKAQYAFVSGLAAAERGELSLANAELETLRRSVESLKAEKDADPEDLKVLAVHASELGGYIQVKSGDIPEGIAELRRAVAIYEAMAFAFGPPVAIKPPEELLGEVLLEQKDAVGARNAFEAALKRAPKRSLSLQGLARAHGLLGG